MGHNLGTCAATILKGEILHPSHHQKVQTLYSIDYVKSEDPRCMLGSLCWVLQKNNESPDFRNSELCADESTFTTLSDGVFNTRNWHAWAEENRHATVMWRNQVRFSVNAGVLSDLIGPYTLPNQPNVNLVLTRDILLDILEDVPSNDRLNTWFQRDSCPSYFGVNVRVI